MSNQIEDDGTAPDSIQDEFADMVAAFEGVEEQEIETDGEAPTSVEEVLEEVSHLS